MTRVAKHSSQTSIISIQGITIKACFLAIFGGVLVYVTLP